MPQLFRPAANTLARLGLIGLVAVPLALVAGMIALRWTPYATGQGRTPEQPIPFSHEHHVGEMGIDCRYCHATVETSSFAGMPTAHVCLTCHSQLYNDQPMLAPLRESERTGRPIAWARVNRLPDYVYFDHSVHVANGVGCAECHGPVHSMPLMSQAAPLTMQWCLDCHRDPGRRLRAPGAIVDTTWTAQNGLKQAKAYLRAYQIHPDHLTDCAVCHR